MSTPSTKSFAKKGPWFVVNMAKRWKKKKITRLHKPTIVYQTLAEAFTAAQQDAGTHTQGQYAVFECIGVVVPTTETKKAIQGKQKPS